VEKNLAFYKFARHVSAWINLVNSLFETMGIQHRLSFDRIMNDFPDTKSQTLSPFEKATLMTHHVCGILNIPVSADDSDFLQDDEDSVVFWVVFQSLLATYNTELPKKETEVLKEVIVRKISIQDLKTLIESANTLDEIFSMCLPYMDSHLIRAFLIQIMMHHFMHGNKGKLDSLLHRLGAFESKFTSEEKSNYRGLFGYIEAPLLSIANLTSYVCSDEELFNPIKESLSTDGEWADAGDVGISDEIVKKVQPRIKFTKKPQPQIDSGMAFGGGAAAVAMEVVDESEEEEELVDDSTEELVEASVKPPFDATRLRELLVVDDRSSAIEYLQSVELGKLEDTLQAVIQMLKIEKNTCARVIKGLIQHQIFEEDSEEED
jgi:hypothetical protein